MNKLKLIFMDGYQQVWIDYYQDSKLSGTVVLNIADLPQEDSNDLDKVIENVVTLINNGDGLEEVDNYLMDECDCSQEDREEILEQLQANYWSK